MAGIKEENGMNYLHYEVKLNQGDVVEVTLDGRANVRLLDDLNYSLYKKGQAHQYYGGLAKKSPVHLSAPYPGRWHVVIDLGGYAGTVTTKVKVIHSE
jgi:hypothetical protein